MSASVEAPPITGLAQICIVAHHARTDMANQLATTIGAHHKPFFDDGRGPTQNHLAAWAWHKDNTTTEWAIVLEDDAQPIKDFHNQLNQALTTAPTDIISLYLGRLRPPHWQHHIQTATTKADQEDANWITTPYLLHAVGIAIRTHHIPDLLNTHPPTPQPIDDHITWYAQGRTHIAYTWPSLINHADTPSILRHPDKMKRQPGRIAWRTGTREQWTSKAVSM